MKSVTEEESFKELLSLVFRNISEGISKIYTYHSPTHVCMVLRDSSYLAGKLNISGNDLRLLKTAASMHDFGFLTSHIDHEENSCREAEKLLPKFGYSKEDIEVICGMIMATKIPQSPKTLLEKILCDADLFYLGSDYYFEIAAEFKKELIALNLLKGEEHWKTIQVGFLENHRYHLPFSQNLLNDKKAENLSILKSKD